jgi:hypothetical protein
MAPREQTKRGKKPASRRKKVGFRRGKNTSARTRQWLGQQINSQTLWTVAQMKGRAAMAFSHSSVGRCEYPPWPRSCRDYPGQPHEERGSGFGHAGTSHTASLGLESRHGKRDACEARRTPATSS